MVLYPLKGGCPCGRGALCPGNEGAGLAGCSPRALKLCSCLADTQRAMAILARYQRILQSPAEQPLRASVEKVVRVFQSELFQALLGKGSWQQLRKWAVPIPGKVPGSRVP